MQQRDELWQMHQAFMAAQLELHNVSAEIKQMHAEMREQNAKLDFILNIRPDTQLVSTRTSHVSISGHLDELG
jgi:hypothetical protein